jgi:hypothetical protein
MVLIYTVIAMIIGLALYALRYCWLFWYGMIEVVVSICVIYLDFNPAVVSSSQVCRGYAVFGAGCWLQSHLVILAGIYVFVRGIDNMVMGWRRRRKQKNNTSDAPPGAERRAHDRSP